MRAAKLVEGYLGSKTTKGAMSLFNRLKYCTKKTMINLMGEVINETFGIFALYGKAKIFAPESRASVNLARTRAR